MRKLYTLLRAIIMLLGAIIIAVMTAELLGWGVQKVLSPLKQRLGDTEENRANFSHVQKGLGLEFKVTYRQGENGVIYYYIIVESTNDGVTIKSAEVNQGKCDYVGGSTDASDEIRHLLKYRPLNSDEPTWEQVHGLPITLGYNQHYFMELDHALCNSIEIKLTTNLGTKTFRFD